MNVTLRSHSFIERQYEMNEYVYISEARLQSSVRVGVILYQKELVLSHLCLSFASPALLEKGVIVFSVVEDKELVRRGSHRKPRGGMYLAKIPNIVLSLHFVHVS